jgi:hypothetical protein
MTSGAALVDKFEALVAAHARLPPGSAAAFNAAVLVLDARTSLIRRMAEDAAEVARLKRVLVACSDIINTLADEK